MNKCYLVDLFGKVFKTTNGEAQRLNPQQNGWIVCKNEDQADRLSRQIKLLRWKDGFQSGPFDKTCLETTDNFVLYNPNGGNHG